MKGNVDLFLNWDPMWSAARMPPEAEAGRVLGEAGEGAPSEEASRQKQRQEHREHSRCTGLPWVYGNLVHHSEEQQPGILISANSPCFLGKVFHFHIGVYIKNEEIKLTGTIFFFS